MLERENELMMELDLVRMEQLTVFVMVVMMACMIHVMMEK